MIKDKLTKAVSRLWTGRCDVVEYAEVTDEKTHITNMQEVTTLKDIPCRISFETIKEAQQTEAPAKGEQIIKLFVGSDINIPEGSKIIVTQNGVTGEYKASGIPAVYTAHQEILLEVFKEWC